MPFLSTNSLAIADSMSSSSSMILKSFPGKLPLHGERDQEFLSHQAQTGRLHRLFVAKKLHANWAPLSDSPGSSAGLPQRVQRIPGLIKNDGGEIQQVQTGLYELGMGDDNLHAILDLPCIPGFPFRGVHAGAQNSCANAFVV